jgi:hypothetical protein
MVLCHTAGLVTGPGAKVSRIKTQCLARHQCLAPVILATQEAEIRRITVRSQPKKIV